MPIILVGLLKYHVFVQLLVQDHKTVFLNDGIILKICY